MGNSTQLELKMLTGMSWDQPASSCLAAAAGDGAWPMGKTHLHGPIMGSGPTRMDPW